MHKKILTESLSKRWVGDGVGYLEVTLVQDLLSGQGRLAARSGQPDNDDVDYIDDNDDDNNDECDE